MTQTKSARPMKEYLLSELNINLKGFKTCVFRIPSHDNKFLIYNKLATKHFKNLFGSEAIHSVYSEHSSFIPPVMYENSKIINRTLLQVISNCLILTYENKLIIVKQNSIFVPLSINK